MRAGMALDDWISSLQWPLQNWPSCPPAIIRGSSNNLTLLNSEQFAWSSNLLTELRHQIDDKRQRCGRGFPWLRTKAQLCRTNLFRFSLNSPWGETAFQGLVANRGMDGRNPLFWFLIWYLYKGLGEKAMSGNKDCCQHRVDQKQKTHFTLVTLKVAKLLTNFETKSLSTFKQQRQKLLSSHSCLKIHFLLLLPMVNRVWWEFGKSVSVDLFQSWGKLESGCRLRLL